MGPSYAFSALMDCTNTASRALGKGIVPTAIVIIGSCFFRIAWVFTVFRHFGTITSLYLVFICSWLVTSSVGYLYFRHVVESLFPRQGG